MDSHDLEAANRPPFSIIIYKEGAHILRRLCFDQSEHDLFMLELLFSTDRPLKEYKAHLMYGDRVARQVKSA